MVNDFAAWTRLFSGNSCGPIPESGYSNLQKRSRIRRTSKTRDRKSLWTRRKSGARKTKADGPRRLSKNRGAIFTAAGFIQLYNSAGAGADNGIDIILCKDTLGAGERIIVQVKHTNDQIGQPDFQKLLGTLKPNEYELMVALNGFSSNSLRFQRENRERLLRPMDSSSLIEMLQEHYEKLQDEDKALLQLKRVLVPFSVDEVE